MNPLLQIQSLTAGPDEATILHELNLTIHPGEVHVIMGPNGAGKSTLSAVITGREDYPVRGGRVYFKGEDITELPMEERARRGIFLTHQSPLAIPGVNNLQFLRFAVNSHRKARGEDEMKPGEFLKKAREYMALLGLPEEFSRRSLNDGFSGGEKKRNEMLQMLMLQPDLVILDEIDSGLDVDGIATISGIIKNYHNENRALLLITHYQKIFETIRPDFVHIFAKGKIIKTGRADLAALVDAGGFEQFLGEKE